MKSDEGRDLLADAAKQFRLYEELHRAKGTPDAYEKSKVNGEFAHRIECFLSSGVDYARTPSPSGAREISEQARELLKSLPANWWLLDALGQPLNGETRAALRAIESALRSQGRGEGG